MKNTLLIRVTIVVISVFFCVQFAISGEHFILSETSDI